MRELPDDAIAAANPIIVVEVLSPSTSNLAGRLADYFRVPSIMHYLIVRAKRRELIHYGAVITRTYVADQIRLDPPGIDLSIDEIYPSGSPIRNEFNLPG